MAYYAGKSALEPGARGQDHGLIQVVAAPGIDTQIGVATHHADTIKMRSFYKITLADGRPLEGEFVLVDGEFKEIH